MGPWRRTLRSSISSLLIIDELGCVPMPADDADALFEVKSQHCLKGIIILTANCGADA